MTDNDFELLDFLLECMNIDKRAACESSFVAGAIGHLFFKYKGDVYEYVEIIKRKNYS